ncbi:ADIPOR-like receptor [Colletotrichum fructicola]|uniref:ADIPOR-like receptor n=1 Tax=Colletotrichum fructicola (strain Nara gc5) TaxID=1213859 RepID=A0A7J6JFN8_COLFN|nr:ADIPOR-like receptor [Colletotrichum fructicola Nara gc5]KAF4905988.1 ADIPOR-like receptor [Colletotrichum fructicola]KAF4917341.1 ADIPOR-like receptor [Colletotrichum fructicola]KAF4935122.1 ADIPOR-like receptor [Colletotrichum fructicola]
MAALLSTSALRRRLQKAFGGESAGRRLRSWGGQAEALEKQTIASALLRWEELPEWQQCGSEHIKTGYRTACFSVWECFHSWTYVHNETINIYSHIIGAILFISLPFLIFGNPISPRWTTASTSDIVVCSIYASGVTVCFVLSTAFHTFMSHSEPYYLAGIKADFHGVLALMWSSTAPLAHYTFPCSPRTRDAYVLLTGTLAALCAAATTRPNLGAVHLGHHRAALFATFGAAAFVLPIGHGALVFGAGVEWARVGGPWILATAGCNALAVLVYWAKFPELWFPRTFDLFGASHQIMHVMVLAAALAGWCVDAEADQDIFGYFHRGTLAEEDKVGKDATWERSR